MLKPHICSLPGQVMSLDPSSKMSGNVFHLYSGRRFTLVSGMVTFTFQQAAIKGSSGHMEVLSPEMSMNSFGKVEMIFPSESVEIQLTPGQFVEIGPGYAYAYYAKEKSCIIETILPDLYPFETVSHILNEPFMQTDLDAIDFKLISQKPVAANEPIEPLVETQPAVTESPSAVSDFPTVVSESPANVSGSPAVVPESPAAASAIPKMALPVREPLTKQRLFPRTALSSVAYLGKLFLLQIISTITIGSTGTVIFTLLYIITLMIIMYLGYQELRDKWQQKILLTLLPGGILISNRFYDALALNWADLASITIEAKSGLSNTSQLNIVFTPTQDQYSADYLKPEYRLLYHYLCKLKFTPPLPSIHILQSEINESLQLVYDELSGLHSESVNHSRQLSI